MDAEQNSILSRDGKVIFIIDDEESITSILTMFLKKNFGCNVVTANNYKQAVELIPKINPFLIFIDINLGDGNGYQLIPQIKKHLGDSAVIVMMSAYASAGEKENAEKAGADVFIPKPFNREVILELVKQYIN